MVLKPPNYYKIINPGTCYDCEHGSWDIKESHIKCNRYSFIADVNGHCDSHTIKE
jgi:hypothetical protein